MEALKSFRQRDTIDQIGKNILWGTDRDEEALLPWVNKINVFINEQGEHKHISHHRSILNNRHNSWYLLVESTLFFFTKATITGPFMYKVWGLHCEDILEKVIVKNVLLTFYRILFYLFLIMSLWLFHWQNPCEYHQKSKAFPSGELKNVYIYIYV